MSSFSEKLSTFIDEYISVHHEGVIEKYREGVEEVSNIQNVYIDPDSIENGEDLREQLESKVPGITDSLWDVFEDRGLLPPEDKTEMYEELADKLQDSGPAAIHHPDLVTESGEPLCLINEPPRELDQKEELVNFVSSRDVDNPNTDDVPGGDIHYAEYVGRHEGQHCNQSREELPDQRDREIDADRQAFIETLKDANEHYKDGNEAYGDKLVSVAETIYEARKIGAENGTDAAHQTASHIKFGKLVDEFAPAADPEQAQNKPEASAENKYDGPDPASTPEPIM